MSFAFAQASSQYGEVGAAVLSSYPFTIAAWVNPASYHDGTLFCIADTAGDTNWHRIICNNNAGSSNTWQCESKDSVATGTTIAASVATLDDWIHIVAVFRNSTYRIMFIDGASILSDTTNVSPAGLDTTSIGRTGSATPSRYFDGRVAEACVWNVELSSGGADSDIFKLAQRSLSPLQIKRQNIVGYWPLIGGGSSQVDVFGGNTISITGATEYAHPLINRRTIVLE